MPKKKSKFYDYRDEKPIHGLPSVWNSFQRPSYEEMLRRFDLIPNTGYQMWSYYMSDHERALEEPILVTYKDENVGEGYMIAKRKVVDEYFDALTWSRLDWKSFAISTSGFGSVSYEDVNDYKKHFKAIVLTPLQAHFLISMFGSKFGIFPQVDINTAPKLVNDEV